MDEELIVVGMRFYPRYKTVNLKIGSKVFLVAEPNNEVNSQAVAVHAIEEGCLIRFTDSTRIGHIRDADLHRVKRVNMGADGIYLNVFKVSRVCPNYLRIDKDRAWVFPEGANQTSSKTSIAGYTLNAGAIGANNISVNSISSVGATTGTILFGNVSYGNISTPNQTKTTESKQMNSLNSNSMLQGFFRKLDNVALDMQTGKLGVKTPTGIVVATDDGVSVNPITEMGFTIPAFAMRVPVDQLQRGDILIGAGQPSFFREGSKVGYLTTTLDGVFQETGIVSNMLFGKNTVLAVKNLFGDNASDGGMNPMMMMAFMGDDKGDGSGFDFKKMMMMQMLMGQGGASNGMNPMMMAMMLGGKDLF